MTADAASGVRFGEAVRFWARLGCISFGGPAGQIAIMREELVVRRRWIDEASFLHALNFCMLLPGPEAQQLATWLGWRLHGVLGGLIAGLLFILPGAVLITALAALYVQYGATPAVSALLWGVQAAVLAIVIAALVRLAERTLQRATTWGIALAALAAILLGVSYPWVVVGAATLGAIALRTATPRSVRDNTSDTVATLGRGTVILLCGVLLAGAVYALLPAGRLADMATFFTGAALVTFGGAYAVLPYVAQASVEHYGWLAPSDLVHALALGESTPGPLILVLAFIAFLGGASDPAASVPLVAGVAAAAVALFFTFLPSFVLVLAGAPLVAWTERQPWLAAALSGITAAVVGVMAALALYLARHTLWRGDGSGALDLPQLVLALAALVALTVFRQSLGRVLVAALAVGALRFTLV
jgi:chromate transporter